MNSKIKIIIVLIIILAGLITFKELKERRCKEGDPVFPREIEVNGLWVVKGNDTLQFSRTQGVWREVRKNWEADTLTLKSFLDNIPSFTRDEVISKNPEKIPVYGLDSASVTHLKIETARHGQFELNIGKTASDYMFSYFQVKGKPEVYKVRGCLELQTSYNSWLKKELFNIAPQNLKNLEYVWKDTLGKIYNLRFTQIDSTKLVFTGAPEVKLDQTQARTLWNRVLNLKVDDWLKDSSGLEKVKSYSSLVKVVFTDNQGKTHVFEPAGEKAGAYAGVFPGRSEWVTLNTWKFTALEKDSAAFILKAEEAHDEHIHEEE